jgi:hypothetical protein
MHPFDQPSRLGRVLYYKHGSSSYGQIIAYQSGLDKPKDGACATRGDIHTFFCALLVFLAASSTQNKFLL